MRSSKIVTTEEAIAICDGRMTAFYELPKYQPIVSEDGYVYCGNFADRYKNDMQHEDWRIQFAKDYSPYPLNTPIYLREQWYKGGHWQFESTNEDRNFQESDSWFWVKEKVLDLPEKQCMQYIKQSAATMPREAARTWIEITEVKCLRFQDLTTEQANASLIGSNAIERMQYAHRQHKEIYERNPFIFLYTFKLVNK